MASSSAAARFLGSRELLQVRVLGLADDLDQVYQGSNGLTGNQLLLAMKLFLSKNVPFNTVLSDEEGHKVYIINTTGKVFNKTTTICRTLAEAGGKDSSDPVEVGKLHWKVVQSSTMEYSCQTYELTSFLPRAGFFGG